MGIRGKLLTPDDQRVIRSLSRLGLSSRKIARATGFARGTIAVVLNGRLQPSHFRGWGLKSRLMRMPAAEIAARFGHLLEEED